MAWLPRSLRGRTLLLTVVAIVACEFVTFAVLGLYRHTLLAGRARDFVSGQVEMVRTALTHATPEQVAEELDTPPRERRARRLFGQRDGRSTGAPRLEPRPPRVDAERDANRDASRDANRDAAPADETSSRLPPPADEGPPGETSGRPPAPLAGETSGRPPPPPADEARQGPPPDRGASADSFAAGAGSGPPVRVHMRLIHDLPAGATTVEPRDLSLPQVVTALRDEFGIDALRFTDDPEPAVWVRMPSVDWWLMLPFSRYASPPIPWPILVATLAAVTVMGSLVGLYVFRLAQPLRALSDAAAKYRVGQRPALPLTGPDEVRAVTRQFNAMAERLDRDEAERRVMLAGLPHDLRAPLARARLRLELMEDEPDGPKVGLQRDLAEVGRIADQFVAYLRGLDHDTSGFTMTPLHEIVRDRGLVWRESGHDVTIEQADVLVREADADALMRAIDNLIGNAFAHGRAPVAIAGRLQTVDRQAAYRIVVRDRGPGIPEAQRAEALKAFTRLDAARGASGHCGLGLAVAQSIARLHGGQIELGEAEGGGLAAAIVLPVSSVPSTVSSAATSLGGTPTGT